MSIEAITWALKQPLEHSPAKFVLVVLANQANSETGNSFPSIAYLATTTGQDRKTIIANLQRLIEWGLIEDTGKRVGRTSQIICYRLLMGPDLFDAGVDKLGTDANLSREKRNSSENGTVPKLQENCANLDQNSTEFPSKQYQFRDTEPFFNQDQKKEQANKFADEQKIATAPRHRSVDRTRTILEEQRARRSKIKSDPDANGKAINHVADALRTAGLRRSTA